MGRLISESAKVFSSTKLKSHNGQTKKSRYPDPDSALTDPTFYYPDPDSASPDIRIFGSDPDRITDRIRISDKSFRPTYMLKIILQTKILKLVWGTCPTLYSSRSSPALRSTPVHHAMRR
ncbi:hypothetical protein YC2023_020803 [Brassica napus]